MTLQNLSKIIDKYEQQLDGSNIQQFELLRGLPFCNWRSSPLSLASPVQTDFNNAIGLPQKNGITSPLFDYEQMLFDVLQNNKHVWIKNHWPRRH